jgi:hypothetical protein
LAEKLHFPKRKAVMAVHDEEEAEVVAGDKDT